MGEEVGEEVGEAVDMGEGMGEAVDMDEGMGVRARRAARQKGSSTGLEVGCNLQRTFQHWRSAPADCCGA